jgi:hypothetical protein
LTKHSILNNLQKATKMQEEGLMSLVDIPYYHTIARTKEIQHAGSGVSCQVCQALWEMGKGVLEGFWVKGQAAWLVGGSRDEANKQG